MKERPIIFSAPMVRAILEGTKVQTRRVVKPQPPEILPAYAPKVYWPARDRHMTHGDMMDAAYLQFERPGDYDGAHVMRGGFGFRCPYGQPGDRLWVREAFRKIDGQTQPWIETDYRATYTHGDRLGDLMGMRPPRWIPSIHMPRAASRITLEVTGVRVDRLQDISEADAIAEGIDMQPRLSGYSKDAGCKWSPANPVEVFCNLWESINGHFSWSANPWVWVIEFKRVTP
jgi:hypothetical protein